MHRVTAAVAFVGLLVAPSIACADEDPFVQRPSAVMGVVGFGTPVGNYGIVGSHALFGILLVEGGVGFVRDINEPFEPQWSIMPRLRVPDDGVFSVSLGAGIGGGRHHSVTGDTFLCLGPCETTRRTWTHALRWNADVALEWRLRMGVSIRGFIGASRVMNDPDTCTGPACGRGLEGYFRLYAGAACGYAF